MSDLALLVRLQARVATFLAELSTDQLVDLAEGRTTLVLTEGINDRPTPAVISQPSASAVAAEIPPPPRAAPIPRPRKRTGPAEPFDAEAIKAQLRACETIDQATELLAALKLTGDNLKQLAKAHNISAGRNKDETARRILNLAVASRSKHAGLRQG